MKIHPVKMVYSSDRARRGARLHRRLETLASIAAGAAIVILNIAVALVAVHFIVKYW